jgi:hypothetical protein
MVMTRPRPKIIRPLKKNLSTKSRLFNLFSAFAALTERETPTRKTNKNAVEIANNLQKPVETVTGTIPKKYKSNTV